ncbi:endonuclease/exonuclease/phosphatase family protein [Cognatitamlana onchidii]|uniref:endonuclease/exonuclease/phosphatase family protein n=1 Tax=Cognatitamlana onchidii TaxID=2562860 RepID=UPI0010A69C05|nr:endonuclease/exonuclease/phosphatase family protein [Algibacter onchidii]
MLKLVKGLYLIVNIAIIVALLLLYFIVRDTSFKYAIWFYSFPLPIIVFIILCLSVFLGKYRKYNLIIAGFVFIIWIGRSFRMSFPIKPQKSDLEIVFWNASRDNGFKTAIEINKGIPDVLVLTESNDYNFNKLKGKYPDFYFYQGKRELRIFSKTPLTIVKDTTTHYSTSVVNFKTAEINFYAVDVTGSIDVPRLWEIGFLYEVILAKENTVILGDFNVPYESTLLKKIKDNYKYFFSSKGNGFRETWFWGLPLLSLDQIWVSPDLEIRTSKNTKTLLSDHSLIGVVLNRG